MEDRRQAEALFRYSLIRELADPELRPRRRGVMTRALAELEHVRDDGRRVRVSAPTLRRWLRYWRAGGYQALLPGEKLQPNRTPAEILEAGFTLKREAPDRTAAMVARILEEAGVGKVSSRTLQRQFARAGLNLRPDGTVAHAYGRFEASEFGELWTGDALQGRWPTAPPPSCSPSSTTSAGRWWAGAGATPRTPSAWRLPSAGAWSPPESRVRSS